MQESFGSFSSTFRVTLDQALTLDQHVNCLICSCFQLRNINKRRSIVSQYVSKSSLHPFQGVSIAAKLQTRSSKTGSYQPGRTCTTKGTSSVISGYMERL